MSTEQMRGEFEQAMKDQLGDLVDLSRAINGDGEYMQWDANVAWIMFQASRAKLVVNIEQHTEFEINHTVSPAPEKDTYAIGWIDGRNYAAKQVRAAGITVKGG